MIEYNNTIYYLWRAENPISYNIYNTIVNNSLEQFKEAFYGHVVNGNAKFSILDKGNLLYLAVIYNSLEIISFLLEHNVIKEYYIDYFDEGIVQYNLTDITNNDKIISLLN